MLSQTAQAKPGELAALNASLLEIIELPTPSLESEFTEGELRTRL